MLEDREGGCHCGRVRFRARVNLELLSQCNCTVCTKKGINLGLAIPRATDWHAARRKASARHL